MTRDQWFNTFQNVGNLRVSSDVARALAQTSAPANRGPAHLPTTLVGSATTTVPVRRNIVAPQIAPRAPQPQAVPLPKRNVFYSFHYSDIYRVNNVRHAEQYRARVTETPQSHYDRSLWESSKRTDPDSLKRLIRDGIKNTSVVCVLVGSETSERRWVRYEIARSIVDQKGLLAVSINSIKHHQHRTADPQGPNPLASMGVGAMPDGTFRLFERMPQLTQWGWQYAWVPYRDYTASVPLPLYLRRPAVGYISLLSSGTNLYDAVRDNVWANMPLWLNDAARAAGRP